MRRLFLLAFLAGGCAAPGPDLQLVNPAHGGEKLELAGSLARGKTTLVEFYSEHCPPCREMAPILEKLAAGRPDLAIRRVDIDRPSASGIDFDSPLALQYAVHAVPDFRVYDSSGHLSAQGDQAREQVRAWYQGL